MHLKHLLAATSILALAGSPAFAADLIVNEQSAPPVYDEPVSDWTGPYVGINAGVAFGIPHTDTTDGCHYEWCGPGLVEWPGPSPLDDNNDDFFPYAGIEAGVNFQVNDNFVVGIEGDLEM